ncbi:MAG: DUF3098 domain-containing protein [Chitinophagaceae bacterium]
MAVKKTPVVQTQPNIKKDHTVVKNKSVITEKKVQIITEKKIIKSEILFTKENYRWMLIGAAVIALGMILMSGGKNPDPNKFDPNLVYSTTRITIAPILIIAGLLVEIYAIFKKPKAIIQ